MWPQVKQIIIVRATVRRHGIFFTGAISVSNLNLAQRKLTRSRASRDQREEIANGTSKPARDNAISRLKCSLGPLVWRTQLLKQMSANFEGSPKQKKLSLLQQTIGGASIAPGGFLLFMMVLWQAVDGKIIISCTAVELIKSTPPRECARLVFAQEEKYV